MLNFFKSKSGPEVKPTIIAVPGEVIKKSDVGETSVDAKYNTVIPIRQSQKETPEMTLTRIEEKLTELEGKPGLANEVLRTHLTREKEKLEGLLQGKQKGGQEGQII